MNRKLKRLLCLALLLLTLTPSARAEEFSAKEVVLEHIKDSHEWHITGEGESSIVIPLPVIVKSSTGWHVFCSSRFEHHADAEGLRHVKADAPADLQGLAIATEGDNAGKIVENGEPVLDLSITKTVAVMFINVALLLCCILLSARWYKRHKASDPAPGGFVGFVEMLVMYVVEDIIKPGVGKGYEKYAPYLLTCFFFIFTCNVMGLIPFPPGSGNVTGNIAVTFFLALCTFVVVQFSGNKHYWKDIFWPDVPTWLKAPVPIIPVIEFVGIFTKPFALMIRLFANIMAGHAIAVAMPCIIFLVATMSVGVFYSMSAVSVLMSIFMMCLECLVCFIQAMVFTLLSSVFIGMARAVPEGH
ncbi:MAG: F0F1 ATP synthase subunit A [Prevotella sp.]|nr:F0F1 ATP synthase subunit A [Prevotella sp.]